MTDEREALLRSRALYVALDEFGRMHSFARTLGPDLVERGILWRDARGYWRVREKDANAIGDTDPDIAVCDFCTARPVAYDCDVADFTNAVGDESVGGWLACATCGALVIWRDVEGLLQRAAARSPVQPIPAVALDALVDFHDRFWRHFRGTVTPMQTVDEVARWRDARPCRTCGHPSKNHADGNRCRKHRCGCGAFR